MQYGFLYVPLSPPTDTTRVARQLAMLGEDGRGALVAALLEPEDWCRLQRTAARGTRVVIGPRRSHPISRSRRSSWMITPSTPRLPRSASSLHSDNG
jgi:hypothetical protein